MSKNTLFLSKGNLYLLKCPICKTKFTGYLRYVTCKNNHTFDFSKSGYINLLMKNKKGIYDKSLFKARKEIIENGFFKQVEEQIIELIINRFQQKKNVVILDLGCGEGSLFINILSALKQKDLYYKAFGIDSSKDGIALASRSDFSVLWLVADIANVPLINNSVDVILNILSPANYGEFNRLLNDDGIIIKVIPNKNYLVELRQSLSLKDYYNEETLSLFHKNTKESTVIKIKHQKRISLDDKKLITRMTPLTEKKTNLTTIDIEDIITLDLSILIGRKKQ